MSFEVPHRRLLTAAAITAELLLPGNRAQAKEIFAGPDALLQQSHACSARTDATQNPPAYTAFRTAVAQRLHNVPTDCGLDLTRTIPHAAENIHRLYSNDSATLTRDLALHLPQLLEILSHPELVDAAERLRALFPKLPFSAKYNLLLEQVATLPPDIVEAAIRMMQDNPDVIIDAENAAAYAENLRRFILVFADTEPTTNTHEQENPANQSVISAHRLRARTILRLGIRGAPLTPTKSGYLEHYKPDTYWQSAMEATAHMIHIGLLPIYERLLSEGETFETVFGKGHGVWSERTLLEIGSEDLIRIARAKHKYDYLQKESLAGLALQYFGNLSEEQRGAGISFFETVADDQRFHAANKKTSLAGEAFFIMWREGFYDSATFLEKMGQLAKDSVTLDSKTSITHKSVVAWVRGAQAIPFARQDVEEQPTGHARLGFLADPEDMPSLEETMTDGYLNQFGITHWLKQKPHMSEIDRRLYQHPLLRFQAFNQVEVENQETKDIILKLADAAASRSDTKPYDFQKISARVTSDLMLRQIPSQQQDRADNTVDGLRDLRIDLATVLRKADVPVELWISMLRGKYRAEQPELSDSERARFTELLTMLDISSWGSITPLHFLLNASERDALLDPTFLHELTMLRERNQRGLQIGDLSLALWLHRHPTISRTIAQYTRSQLASNVQKMLVGKRQFQRSDVVHYCDNQHTLASLSYLELAKVYLLLKNFTPTFATEVGDAIQRDWDDTRTEYGGSVGFNNKERLIIALDDPEKTTNTGNTSYQPTSTFLNATAGGMMFHLHFHAVPDMHVASYAGPSIPDINVATTFRRDALVITPLAPPTTDGPNYFNVDYYNGSGGLLDLGAWPMR